MHVHGAGFTVILIAPNAIQQEIAGQNLAAAENEHLEQFKFLEGQRELFAALKGFIIGNIDHDIAGTQGLRLALLLRRDAAQQGFYAGGQLAHGKRLGDVIVRAQFQAEDLIDLVAPCGQHDDRDVAGGAVAL